MAPDFPGVPIVIFDGNCAFCGGSVAFIRSRAPAGKFRFVARQTAEGGALLERHGVDPALTNSMVLLEAGAAHLRSDAALRIARHFRAPWNALAAFRIVPRGLRDMVYGFISRNRHRWSRPADVCVRPEE